MDAQKAKRIYQPSAVPAANLFKSGKQRHIAAYARVSTASDEQLNSVETQKDYFAKLIRRSGSSSPSPTARKSSQCYENI